MKTLNRYSIILIWFIGVILASCQRDQDHEPITKKGNAPGVITDVQVSPTPGGAYINYVLPDDSDLLYVKAIYQLSNGEEAEVKSSLYKNYIIIEGLGDTLDHSALLYAVNRSEVASEPIEVSFKPQEPAFWNTFRSIQIEATFGGINIKALNEAKDNLAYLILELNEFDEWELTKNTLYSAAEEINYTIRGLDTISYTYGIAIRDRYLNYTDTIFSTFTPFFEEPIPNSKYLFRVLPGDAPRHTSTLNARALWDGNTKGWPNSVMLTQAAFTPFEPHLITVDLGQQAKLSRVHIWDYPEWDGGNQNVYFARGAMKIFEIYGSANYNPSGQLDSTWVKLGEYESIKPSGLPEWVVNTDDVEKGEAGLSYDVDILAPKVRYLRIKCIENWEGGSFLAIAEVQVYGNTQVD